MTTFFWENVEFFLTWKILPFFFKEKSYELNFGKEVFEKKSWEYEV
jgi:hypothetical protein